MDGGPWIWVALLGVAAVLYFGAARLADRVSQSRLGLGDSVRAVVKDKKQMGSWSSGDRIDGYFIVVQPGIDEDNVQQVQEVEVDAETYWGVAVGDTVDLYASGRGAKLRHVSMPRSTSAVIARVAGLMVLAWAAWVGFQYFDN